MLPRLIHVVVEAHGRAKGVTCLASSGFLRPLMGELTQIFEYGKRLYVW